MLFRSIKLEPSSGSAPCVIYDKRGIEITESRLNDKVVQIDFSFPGKNSRFYGGLFTNIVCYKALTQSEIPFVFMNIKDTSIAMKKTDFDSVKDSIIEFAKQVSSLQSEVIEAFQDASDKIDDDTIRERSSEIVRPPTPSVLRPHKTHSYGSNLYLLSELSTVLEYGF